MALAIAGLAQFAKAQPCVPAPTGIVGWWPAEGNGISIIGPNTATASGGISYVPGVVGQAFNFDGTGDLVIPAATNLAFQNLTVETWIMAGDLNEPQPIIEYGNATGLCSMNLWHGWGPGLSLLPGSLTAFFRNPDNSAGVGVESPGGLLQSNQWSHIALTYDTSNYTARLYHNGVLVGEATSGEPVHPNGMLNVNLGYRPVGSADLFGGRRLTGKLDEVGIYNRVLSISEIQAIYAAGAAGKCSTVPPFIISQPTNRIVGAGSNATFIVSAGGASPLQYQWRFNGSSLFVETNASLTVTNVGPNQTGAYSVAITNLYGWVISSNAMLNLLPPPTCATGTGVVSWWRGEGDAFDAANTNYGTPVGGMTFSPGKVGQAFAFNVTNAYVLVSDSPGLRFTSAMSVEAWIYPYTRSTRSREILSKWEGASNQRAYTFNISPTARGAFSVSPNGSSSATTVTTTSLIPTNTWSHLAAVYDGASLRIYLNGVLESTIAYAQGIFPGSVPMTIGSTITSGSYFDGLIDEPTVYNRALPASEIQAIYSAGSLGKCFTPIAPTITLQPSNRVVNLFGNTTFQVSVSGTSPFNYQWYRNGDVIAGATNRFLSLTNVQPSMAGTYALAVTNQLGFTVSSNALLKVRVMAAFGNGIPLTNSAHVFNTNVTVQLQSFFPNGITFYTLDGSTPSYLSSQYSGPFLVTKSSALRALAYSADFFEAGELDPIQIFLPPAYPLSVSTGGGGNINVTPPGPYLSNTVVTLSAIPAAGWVFLKWTDDATGTSAVTNIAMTRPKSVKAIFGTSLNTTAAGGGLVTLTPPGGVYPYGTTVQVSGIPDVGNQFALWGNAASGNVNPLLFVLSNANPTVSSLFVPVPGGQFALTVVPLGRGQVTVSPRANAYATGSGVTITANPDSGQTFLGWSGDAVGSQNPLATIVNSNRTIFANFTTRPQLTISPSGSLQTEGPQLTILGNAGEAYRLESSTNLSQWATVTNLTNSYGSVQFTDSGATNKPQILYRAGRLE